MRFLSFGLAILFFAASNAFGAPVAAVSPDGHVRIEFALRKHLQTEDVPQYRVTFHDRVIIAWSRLGVELDGSFLGGPCEVLATDARSARQEFTQVTGKRSEVKVDGAEMVIALREKSIPKRAWEIHLRATDDGAAFRYRFPKQDGWDKLVLRGELTEFHAPGEAKAFALPLNGYTTSYEKRYQAKPAKELSKEWLLGMPLLLECPGGDWAAITEANVAEYAGMYLATTGQGVLLGKLSPLPSDAKIAVRHDLPHSSPWRTILVADHPGRLLESDFILSLNEPRAIPDTSWIKTGKTTFPWWNGFHEEKVDFKPGLNTATAKHYVDFCSEAGIPYHSLDGVGNTAWYGGPIVPYKGAEPTKGVEGLDVPEVLRYAKTKGVRIRLWMHWGAAAAHMKKAFPLYREWGIEGIMLDFMDRDDQEMNRFVREAVALAAENQLTVTLHGCPKPTGLERTYPNLLTHEGVMNLEYDKWDKLGISSEHEVTVPFTRMLAGPLDFHQGSFRTVRAKDFQPRNEAPLVIGTPARTLAGYVVFQNHLSMVADYPNAYRGHPGTKVLAAIPTTWDDTKVLDTKVGEFLAVGRRYGKSWHVGAMTDSQPRTVKLPLTFLHTGEYTASIWSDDGAAKHGLKHREIAVKAGDELKLELEEGGGAYIVFTPR